MVSFNTLKLCTELGCKVGKAKPPKINFGAVSKPIEQATPSFKIGTPTRIEQATREMTGATQLAQQNRSFIIGNKKVISDYSPVNNTKYPRLTSDMSSLEPMQNIEAFRADFQRRTGLNLHVPDNWNLRVMTNITDWIELGLKNGKLPPDIKHVVMGHGRGLSTNGTWVFDYSGKSVPEWINTHITPGEKCLVAVCETGNTTFNRATPAIGTKVMNSFTNAAQPCKVMQSGNNNIVGHYLTNDGVTYYKPKGFTFSPARKTEGFIAEAIPYSKDGASVTLTCRSGTASFEGDPSFLRNLKGYTDSDGNILPYIFVDILEVFNKGNGLGRAIMEDIKQIARERCEGRLLLIPFNSHRNPSPFYYKCGLRPTTQEASKELSIYFQNGTPLKSGGSSMMYLPIE